MRSCTAAARGRYDDFLSFKIFCKALDNLLKDLIEFRKYWLRYRDEVDGFVLRTELVTAIDEQLMEMNI